MKSNDLLISDISISTASVDIQVMRVGAKQMTLAVFRQLQRQDIFDESGELLAVPWGWVNYDSHIATKPFVFSYQGVLYRSDVDVTQLHYLRIEPEISKWREPLHVSTGKWLIQVPESQWYGKWNSLWTGHCRLSLRFDSQADALGHLENRQRNIAVLEEVPQLFIGV